jgi:DNA repair exonuclease SbcCD ATPase subunit
MAGQNPELLQMRELLRATQAHRDRLSQEDTQLRREFSKKQEKLRQELQQLTRIEAQKNQDVAQIKQNLAHLAKARQGMCVMCQRPWEQAQTHVAQLEQANAELEKRIVAAEETCTNLASLEAELRQVFAENPLVRKFSDAASVLDKRLHEKALECAAGPVTDAQEKVLGLKQQKSEVLAQINSIEFQIRSVQQVNARLETSSKQFKDNLLQTKNCLQSRTEALEKSRIELAAELDFVAAMGPRGFLGAIFEEVLAEIQAETNERLGRLANVSHITVRFSTETVTQKGIVNKAILTTVFLDGQEAKLKTLSGGQFTSLDGVVDLAVGAVIQRRSGVVPGWLCLDECWNGQGVATKEAVLEVLKEYARDRLVLVIDHSSEFVEAFNQTIEVEYVDGKSRIA